MPTTIHSSSLPSNRFHTVLRALALLTPLAGCGITVRPDAGPDAVPDGGVAQVDGGPSCEPDSAMLPLYAPNMAIGDSAVCLSAAIAHLGERCLHIGEGCGSEAWLGTVHHGMACKLSCGVAVWQPTENSIVGGPLFAPSLLG